MAVKIAMFSYDLIYNLTYRDLEEKSRISEVLRKALKEVPDYSTICKAAKRLREEDLRKLLEESSKLLGVKLEILAVDSTGLREENRLHLHLLRDYNLIDLDKSTYLPFGYSYGATWTFKCLESFYHPFYHKQFVNYIVDYMFKDDKFKKVVSKYNRFWEDIKLSGEYNITIKVNLGSCQK